MKIKSLIFALCTLGLVFGGGVTLTAQGVSSACVPFNYNLGIGMRGHEVVRLQSVLITQGYLQNGLGTGYYGGLTFIAVKRFQSAYGVNATGFVGPQTRATLTSLSCGNNPIPPTNQAPTITSINPTSGQIGTSVTIYGRNFNRTSGNSIYINGTPNVITGVISNDGVSLQFNVPSTISGPCPIGYTCSPAHTQLGNISFSVHNGFGTSNSVNFYVTNNTNPNSPAPTITSISPSYGPYGTEVTIYGTNFSRNFANSINFANVQNVATNVASQNGTSLQFRIPATPCAQGSVCAQVVLNPGFYGISVNNEYGTSNSYNFQLTADTSNPGGPNPNPVINSVDGPTSLAVGQQGTWTVQGSNSGGGNLTYSVIWGDESVQGNSMAINDTYLQSTTFRHAYQNPGTYTPRFTIRNNTGREVTSTITVVVGGNTTVNIPTLTSLYPTTGRFGNPITLTGTNFHRYNNHVNFGNVARAAINIPSYDGKTLQFTPTGSTCSADAYVCTLQALGDGNYPISVTTPLGTSNALTFTVSSSANTQNQVLALNQTAHVGTVILTPVEILEDSRCPLNVTCIQAGRVVVMTDIRSTYGHTTIPLSSTGQIFYTEDGYKVQIVDVTPARTSTSVIPSGEYRISYKIWR